MNECTQSERLGAYRDGELPPEARAEVESHLRSCPPCATELLRIERLAGMARAMAVEPMPQAALDRLHRRVDALPVRPVLRMAEALAAVAAMILIGCIATLTMGGLHHEPSRPTAGWDETQAVVEQPVEASSGGPEERVAMWMVQDLSEGSERE